MISLADHDGTYLRMTTNNLTFAEAIKHLVAQTLAQTHASKPQASQPASTQVADSQATLSKKSQTKPKAAKANLAQVHAADDKAHQANAAKAHKSSPKDPGVFKPIFKPTSVAHYLESIAHNEQALQHMTAVLEHVRKTFPELAEKISFCVPTFYLPSHKGFVIHFAAHSKHLGIYPGPELVARFEKKGIFAKYGVKWSAGTIQVQFKQEIPFALIDEMIQDAIADKLQNGTPVPQKKSRKAS